MPLDVWVLVGPADFELVLQLHEFLLEGEAEVGLDFPTHSLLPAEHVAL